MRVEFSKEAYNKIMPVNALQSQVCHSSETIVSVVVVVYNMAREAPRTLYTLTPAYQDCNSKQYEVIVLDNGSDTPLDKHLVESMSDNFRYIYLKNAHPSPALALNYGVKLAKGKILGLMIDGARMLSPGILQNVIRCYRAYKHPVVITLGFHLGSEFQPDAVLRGYNQQKEDELLDSVSWRENGYELFNISCFSESSKSGWFGPISESNCMFLKTSDWSISEGFDESFDLPGGGMANLDFYYRVCTNKYFEPILMLGEGTFHQFHNGSMTGKKRHELKEKSMALKKQYFKIRGKHFHAPKVNYQYIGQISDYSYNFLEQSVLKKQKMTIGKSCRKKLLGFINQYPTFSNLLKTHYRKIDN